MNLEKSIKFIRKFTSAGFLVLLFSYSAFGAHVYPDEGIFIEYDKFSSNDVSWDGTIGAKFKFFHYKDFSLAANGWIETVSHKAINFSHGAGLTDIDYRLEPRLYWKNYYFSFNHLSLHKADQFGSVPNLNLLTFATENDFKFLKFCFGVEFALNNSDADYDKYFFADGKFNLWKFKYGNLYFREIIEAFPGILSKSELGLSINTDKAWFLKSVDLYGGFEQGNESKKRELSSQYGLSADGFFGGARIHF